MRPPILRSRNVTVGEPPKSVELGLPGSREDALNYMDKLNRAADRLQAVVAPWVREKWEDVPVDKQKPPTDDERRFLVNWPAEYAKWKAFTVRAVEPDWLFPPAPSAIWNECILFDKELETYRQLFAQVTKGLKVQPPPPPPEGGYESPQGVKQPGLFDSLFGNFPWVPVIATAGVIGGSVVAVSYYASKKGSSK